MPSCVPLFLSPPFPSTPFILLYVYASLSHYSISWRCCVWCVCWSSCSLPLRPINRSLSCVAFVFCICIAGRASWWLLGRLHWLLVQDWWVSLILSQSDWFSVLLSLPLQCTPPPILHIHTLQSYDSLSSGSINCKDSPIFWDVFLSIPVVCGKNKLILLRCNDAWVRFVRC